MSDLTDYLTNNWCVNRFVIYGTPKKIMLLFNEQHNLDEDIRKIMAYAPIPHEVDWIKEYDLNSKGEIDYHTHVIQQTPKEVEFDFETPHNPPLRVIDKIAEQFNDLLFRLEFKKPGMASLGCACWAEGKRLKCNFGFEEVQP